MWGWLIRAIAWASTASVGWVASDVYSNYQATGDIKSSLITIKPKIPIILILIVVFLVVVWVFKFFKLKISK